MHCLVRIMFYSEFVYLGITTSPSLWGHHSFDRMVVGFTTTVSISVYHHLHCEFKSFSWRGVLDTTLCGKVCQWLAAGRWFSLAIPVFSTYKTDCHDIAEILLKVVLNTITLTLPLSKYLFLCWNNDWNKILWYSNVLDIRYKILSSSQYIPSIYFCWKDSWLS